MRADFLYSGKLFVKAEIVFAFAFFQIENSRCYYVLAFAVLFARVNKNFGVTVIVFTVNIAG